MAAENGLIAFFLAAEAGLTDPTLDFLITLTLLIGLGFTTVLSSI